jgi:6-phosphogluconate dehydrogenase
MVGGSVEDIATLQPIFDTLKPPGDAGFVHAGGVGAGHFVKMVHNGIEYGMMQAYAEGYELMAATPLIEDVEGTMASWRQGTVIRSWLLDLAVRALDEDPGLAQIRGVAADSGEGRWTLEAAIEARVPMPVIASSLFARFTSQQEDSPTIKMVAALRNQFGGHAVTGADGTASAPLQHPQS